uniref:Uncharacterized protein n=1 Tax=Rhizophagus irregularis (strain DAOM 181602 / DAOM 197198 / MUCL 43194) TaxID=747089 RepID=U9T9A3_RHIID
MAIFVSHIHLKKRKTNRICYQEKLLGDGSMDVKFVMNAIITHICIAKGIKKSQKEFISDVNVLK